MYYPFNGQSTKLDQTVQGGSEATFEGVNKNCFRSFFVS